VRLRNGYPCRHCGSSTIRSNNKQQEESSFPFPWLRDGISLVGKSRQPTR
jgi:hypothetical protein